MISELAAALRRYGLPGLFVLLALAAAAQAQITIRHDFAASLNRDNIQAFLEEIEKITNNQRPDLSSDDIATYLANHLTDDGQYTNVTHLELPGKPAQDIPENLNKQQYIDGVTKGEATQQDHKSTIDIQSLDISADGKRATLKTVTKEHGALMMPNDQGTPQPTPIAGESACDETLVVSASNLLQIQKADCKSSIKLDPWNGKPLVPN